MTKSSDTNERTVSIGLFNQAETYRRSAKALMSIEGRWTHPSDPVYFLFHHSIELFLKSYIRKYESYDYVKKFGHDLKKLMIECEKLGLENNPTVKYLVENFDLTFFSTVKYIKTGFRTAPSLELLSKVAAELLAECVSSFLDEHPSLNWSLGGVSNILAHETFSLN